MEPLVGIHGIKAIPITETLRLDNTNASSSFSHWVTEPTDSVFSMGSGFGSGESYVCYCWHEVEGFSKFGSYYGNGNVNSPFVYCGFKPAWIMMLNHMEVVMVVIVVVMQVGQYMIPPEVQ